MSSADTGGALGVGAGAGTSTSTSTSAGGGAKKQTTTREFRPKTKVVVRHLPFQLKEETFLEAVKQWREQYDAVHFVPGKPGRGSTRAYLNFREPAFVFDFCEKFGGHVFVDAKGGEHRAIVEYSPFQKVPKGRRRQDLRRGPLEQDPDFLKFVEQLNAPKEVRQSAEQQLEKRLAEERDLIAASGGVMPPIITPLIEELRAKRKAKQKQGGRVQKRGFETKSDRRSEAWKKEKGQHPREGNPTRRPKADKDAKEKRPTQILQRKQQITPAVSSTTATPENSAPAPQPVRPKQRRERKDRQGQGQQHEGRNRGNKKRPDQPAKAADPKTAHDTQPQSPAHSNPPPATKPDK